MDKLPWRGRFPSPLCSDNFCKKYGSVKQSFEGVLKLLVTVLGFHAEQLHFV